MRCIVLLSVVVFAAFTQAAAVSGSAPLRFDITKPDVQDAARCSVCHLLPGWLEEATSPTSDTTNGYTDWWTFCNSKRPQVGWLAIDGSPVPEVRVLQGSPGAVAPMNGVVFENLCLQVTAKHGAAVKGHLARRRREGTEEVKYDVKSLCRCTPFGGLRADEQLALLREPQHTDGTTASNEL